MKMSEEIKRLLNAPCRWNLFIGFFYKSKDIPAFKEIILKLQKQNEELKDYLVRINRNPIMDGFPMSEMTYLETEEFFKRFKQKTGDKK